MQGVPEIRVRLEEIVTKRMLKMFNVTAEQGKEKSELSFLKEDPGKWEMNATFL